MNEIAKSFFNRFDNFFSRSVAPLSSFISLFFLIDLFFNQKEYLNLIIEHYEKISEHSTFLIFTLLILAFGAGFLLSIIQQLLDEFNKENFEVFWSKENSKLTCLRDHVIKRLQEDPHFKHIHPCYSMESLSDYDLYGILKSSVYNSKQDTTSYNDQTKFIYTTFISMIFIIAFYIFTKFKLIVCCKIALFILSASFLSFIAIRFARMRYRARNIRLYRNFLLSQTEEQHNESNNNHRS